MSTDTRVFERRASPRLEVEALLQGVLVAGELKVGLRDLGFGGFAVESPIGFTIGSRHTFRFTTEAGMALSLNADAIYSRSIGPKDGMTHHVTGFRFVSDAATDDQALQILLGAAVAPLSFV